MNAETDLHLLALQVRDGEAEHPIGSFQWHARASALASRVAATTTREDAPDAGGGAEELSDLTADLARREQACRELLQSDISEGARARISGKAEAFNIAYRLALAATARPDDNAHASPAPEQDISFRSNTTLGWFSALARKHGFHTQADWLDRERLAPPASAPAADAEGGE